MWDKNANLHSYDEVENLANFANGQEIELYRQERLNSVSDTANFIRKNIYKSVPLSVLDIGSGSSCLLYRLKDERMLERGVGVELSKSRHAFAEKWKEAGHYREITNTNIDAREFQAAPGTFDLCTVLDHTFALFYPVDTAMPENMLKKIHALLKPQGILILEITLFAKANKIWEVTDNYTEWTELPVTNKFRYALYSTTYDKKNDIIRAESRYLFRNNLQEKQKVEFYKKYDLSSLTEILKKFYFQINEIFENFQGKSFDPTVSERFLVVCKKV
jgi:SAM-dependent methyltransferase